MANKQQLLKKIMRGVGAWNQWRLKNSKIVPNLDGADLRGADLSGADLSGALLANVNLRDANLGSATLSSAQLTGANLRDTNLRDANLSSAHLIDATAQGADFKDAILNDAILSRANLRDANLSGAKLNKVYLGGADLRDADLSGAKLSRANLRGADFSGANLSRANLSRAKLSRANLSGANLSRADLSGALLFGTQLVMTDLSHAILTGCSVFGISAWKLKLDGAVQRNLVITEKDEPTITVDNLEVAQFIYLLLRNEKVRDIIDTVTSKVVLILGRFTEERKAVLDAIREELRRRDYLPVLFDFEKPVSKDVTGTVETLARMSRFIIADLTDPSSIPHELATVVPFLRTTPVLPIRLTGAGGYTMFVDLQRAYKWVIKTHEYKDGPSLISALPKIIAPAEKMADKLRDSKSVRKSAMPPS